MSSILHIGDGRTATDAILQHLKKGGYEIFDASVPDLRNRLSAADLSVDAALISPAVMAPVSIARDLHKSRPDTHIVFVTDDAHEAALRRELMYAPRIGNHWSVVKADAGEVAVSTIRSAVENASRRRQLRTTLGRINDAMTAPQPEVRKLPVVSDEFIATVFDQLTDAVIMVDPDGSVIAANATASQMLGREIVRGLRFAEIIQVPDTRGRHPVEMKFSRPDGIELTLEITMEPVRNVRASQAGTAVVIRDVSERVRREQRRRLLADATARLSESLDLRQSLQKFADAIVGSLADVCVIDLVEGDEMVRVAVATGTGSDSEAVERLRKFSPGSRAGHPSVSSVRRGELIVRNDIQPEQWRETTAHAEQLEVIQQLELHSLVSAPIPVGEQVAGAIVLVRGRRRDAFSEHDVDLIRELSARAGNALHHAWLYQAAEQANRAKDAFLATLSHELRTPMTSILGWIQILRMGATDDLSLEEGLRVIEKSARVQAQLIEDLLDLSRVDTGKLHLDVQEVDLGEVASAAVDTITPAASAKHITLNVSVEPRVCINGDPNRLQQVIWNLLSNAVKFTPRDGVVSMSVETVGSRARVTVRDTGKGIDPEFLPFVFERFQQADSATTRRFGGLGLGLSIVRQLVELHGGSVQAFSDGEGRGASFTVYLPIPAVRSRRAEPDHQVPVPWLEGSPLAGSSILVVEDDPSSAAMVRRLLEHAGARVELCDSVSGALDLLRTTRPDVLISDIAMPGEDGFDLIRQVRNRLRIPPERLPALALSAFGDMQTRVAALGAGFQLHLQKPAEVADIVAAVVELRNRQEPQDGPSGERIG